MRAFLLVLLGIAGCGGSPAPVVFPKPADAANAERIPRGEGHQDYFVLKRQYPATDVLDHYGRVFKEWIPCYWDQRGWVGFTDSSSGSPKYVHRVTRSWIRSDNKAMATVSASYESADAPCREVPDNDRQTVIVLYDALGDARGQALALGFKCDVAVGGTVDLLASAKSCAGAQPQ